MTCHEIKNVTVPYLELDLEPSRIRDITLHLDGCAECRVDMEAVRQVLVRVKGLAVPDPGDRFWDDFPDRVRLELARERPPIPFSLRLWKGRAVWPMALAATMLFVVGAWSLAGLFDRGSPPSQSSTVAQTPTVAEYDLPQLDEAEWQQFWDEDPDLALADMAAGLDRQAVDRLFKDI